MAAKVKSTEHLALAQDESTSEETLSLLWSKTRSVKVRKAIAKNPNANGVILREAARLYLEEVLENPSFSILSLFSEDEWIKNLEGMYTNPQEYFNKPGILWGRSGSGSSAYQNKDLYCWAALLSPKLSPDALDRILQTMTGEKLKRALNNPSVFERVRDVYIKALKDSDIVWSISLGSMLLLHKKGIIDNDYLFEGLSNFGVGSVSCSRREFSAFLTRLCENYINSKKTGALDNRIPKLLAKTLLVSRAYMLNWIPYSHCVADVLKWSGEFYTEILSYMFKATRSVQVLTNEHITSISNIVCEYLRQRFLFSQKRTEIDPNFSYKNLEDLYEYLKSYDLLELRFERVDFSLIKKEILKEMVKCKPNVKEFFVRSRCLHNWAAINKFDDRYNIINDANEYVYAREGITNNLLFTSCSIRKVVSLGDHLHIF